MKVASLLLSLLFGCAAGLVPVLPVEKPIPSQYIVVFKEGADPTAHFSMVESSLLARENPSVEILHKYSMKGFQGYAIRCTAELLQLIQTDEETVETIEEDGYAIISGVQQNPPSWGLDRTSQRSLPLDRTYRYPNSAGQGVDMYTLDTGINVYHNDYSGRVRWGYTAPSAGGNDDRNGHGTHCSGTMAGTRYGIAKKANLIAVKVLGDLGSGSYSDIISGVNWVANQHRSGKKSVANMSLGGGASSSLDNAVNACARQGVYIAAAAGNDNRDACSSSPARATGAVTVGSTDSYDRKSSFSNYGRCVDIHAPGSSITSTWIGSSSATRTISGTSMAAPHVAGVMALYLAQGKAPTHSALQRDATPNVISGLPSGTVNLLLFANDGTEAAPIEASYY